MCRGLAFMPAKARIAAPNSEGAPCSIPGMALARPHWRRAGFA